MTDVLTGLPPASWYPDPDPAHPHLLRWWDGSAWSVYTMDATDEAPAPDPGEVAATSATAPVASAPDLPPVLHTVPQSIPEPMPFASGVSLGADGSELRGTEAPLLTPIERAARAEIYANLARSHAKEAAPPTRSMSDPFGDFSNAPRMNWNSAASRTSQTTMYAQGPLSSSTLGVWLLVLWPTAGSLLAKFLLVIVLSFPSPSSQLMALITILAGYLLVPFIFASMDRAALGRIGHEKRPRGWWLLTTWLGYLIARTAIISGRSTKAFVPLLVFVLIWVGSAAFNVLTSPEFSALTSP